VPPFRDTVSNEISEDGIGLCGEQTYEVFERINGELRVADFATLTVDSNNNLVINVQTSED
jgi:hypothetical protein